jgi:hypothetical protein
MQHPNKHTYNVSLKKQMKHLEQTFSTYVYSHYNIYNIPIYFCNILMKHLYHISETFEKYVCNIRWSGGASIAQCIHPSACAGLTFLLTGEVDEGAGTDLPFWNGQGGWWRGVARDGAWVRRRRAGEGHDGQVRCLQ